VLAEHSFGCVGIAVEAGLQDGPVLADRDQGSSWEDTRFDLDDLRHEPQPSIRGVDEFIVERGHHRQVEGILELVEQGRDTFVRLDAGDLVGDFGIRPSRSRSTFSGADIA
jgi:hypothetical protein